MGAVWVHDFHRFFHCFESEFQHCRHQATLCYEAIILLLTIEVVSQTSTTIHTKLFNKVSLGSKNICTSGMMWFTQPTSTCSPTSFLSPPCCSPHLPFSPGRYGTQAPPSSTCKWWWIGFKNQTRVIQTQGLPTHNLPIKWWHLHKWPHKKKDLKLKDRRHLPSHCKLTIQHSCRKPCHIRINVTIQAHPTSLAQKVPRKFCWILYSVSSTQVFGWGFWGSQVAWGHPWHHKASLRSRPQRALLPIPFTCQTCHMLD